jgi:mannitol/fructose-specific phosphotransferase system IIA component (Ntr-type)
LPLKTLLTSDHVAVLSRSRTAEDVLAELVRLAVGDTPASADLVSAVRQREATFPTYLGDGVAFPHVRTTLVSELVVSACLLEEPIAFGVANGNDVDMLFLLLSPANAPSEHLSMLRELSHLVGDADVLFRLRHALTAAEFVAVVNATEFA